MLRTRLTLVLMLFVVTGCGRQGPVKRSWGHMKGLEELVGNMNDRSYSKTRGKPRPNALGRPVKMESLSGRSVWSEYAATWCGVCASQAPQTRQADEALGDKVVFLTIMTGKSRNYNDHATVDTAGQWAGRFGLAPDHVLAAQLWFKTIPEHRFYSPQGHTLFVHVGYLSAEQIKEVIAYYGPAWENWAKSGLKADWMTFR